MKYILVTGGVISGVGKGIISSSLGVICQSLGLVCTSIKIDPYINIDAGTFSPAEHGEVFVLDDGSEVDLDCGNYERFLGIRLNSDSNLTTGKVFNKIITDERNGRYLGKTVQYVPHVTDLIQEWISSVASTEICNDQGEKLKPQVCVIELGGTIGDIESMTFIEALTQFRLKVGPSNFLCIHVSLVIEPHSTGDQKTKPTQRSVRDLRSYGFIPDLIICRSHKALAPSIHSKLAASCLVLPENLISVPDMNLYRVPLYLVEQGILPLVTEKLNLPNPVLNFSQWTQLVEASENCSSQVKIALVGKYVSSSDAYASVLKATGHAALSFRAKVNWLFIDSSHLEPTAEQKEYDTAWDRLKKADAVIVPGGFDKRGVEGKIICLKYCRTNKIPCLGICLGFQLAVIEFSRNVLDIEDANSTEFAPTTESPVIIEMPEHNTGKMGGTMRLGLKKTIFSNNNSILRNFYNKDIIMERHRHRYEVNTEFIPRLEESGMIFVGKSEDGIRMQVLELSDHPYFIGVQFHPEFLSRPNKPSPPFVGLISEALKIHG